MKRQNVISVFGSLTFACLALSHVHSANAVSPAAITEGRILFEQDWSPKNPQLGHDGLGPLFNGRSCVACHNQGGVGGAGDARFNAKTIGIERMQINGRAIDSGVIAEAVKGFHPGFIGPGGAVVNTFALSHHGGTEMLDRSRQAFMKEALAEFSEHGGPVSAEEVRYANAAPILYLTQQGPYKIRIQARMFQRNTTPLFGAGLIDQVTDRQLETLEREQKKHPEISGRLATLPDGRYGRFGWRGNVSTLLDFCDQACAAEVGLETARKRQPIDPTNPAYRNPSRDISDQQIKSIKAFVAALPRPHRAEPVDTQTRHQVLRGERVFAEVGCAVCHTPSVGSATDLYSDLLLHDMGYSSMDLNHADPYISRVTPVTDVSTQLTRQTRTVERNSVGYYGGSSTMTMDDTPGNASSAGRNRPSRTLKLNNYDFVAPTQPTQKMRTVFHGAESKDTTITEDLGTIKTRTEFLRGLRTGTRRTTVTKNFRLTKTEYTRIHFEPTNFNQEWRTPPLWGVRDSAPYMHDGRAETMLEAISMHDGESAGTRDRFLNLSLDDRKAVIAFLNTLVAPSTAPTTSAGT